MMKKITIECEIQSQLDFLPDNAKYKGELIEAKTRRDKSSGSYQSTLIIKITQFSRKEENDGTYQRKGETDKT